jgi:tRNA(Ile)-lysidine synthase
MMFSPDKLLRQLRELPEVPCYQLAYSGGLDSHVLLHALAGLRAELGAGIGAVHVNHGLQAAAGQWEVHCRQVCAKLEIDFVSLQVDAGAMSGESPEAAARVARYQALADWLPAGHGLLTAQHQDDQAETLLLQLLRGSGVSGLAAMPASTVLGQGLHLRPMLAVTRESLHDYALRYGLSWVEDPSNADTAYDRNFLRQRILPLLQERWPAVSASLSRSAVHCAEAAELLESLGVQDLHEVAGTQPKALSLTHMAALPVKRQRNVLRLWIREAAGMPPSTAVLARIQNDIPGSRPDAEPCVRWGQHEVRRYRDNLFLLRQSPEPDRNRVVGWNMTEPLSLPDAGGVLSVSQQTGQGIRKTAIADAGVQVAWRHGGERCHPAGRGHHHSLKKLYQEQGIPPWERARIPLIYIGDEIAAVAGLWVCEPFQAGPKESGLLINWKRHNKSILAR